MQVDTVGLLPCQAMSDNPTSVISYSWIKDSQPFVPDGHVFFIDSDTSGNLTFNPVLFDDGGVYQCVVMTMHEGQLAPTVRTVDIRVDISGNTILLKA